MEKKAYCNEIADNDNYMSNLRIFALPSMSIGRVRYFAAEGS
jgi:hypothetical protein